MSRRASRRDCNGMTKRGTPCGAQPLKGKDFCWRHIGDAASDTSNGTRVPAREDWDRQAFLGAYAYTMLVSEACRMVGIAKSTAYLERQRNEEFALAWTEINDEIVEKLEAEAFRRAHDGVPRMVVSAGKKLGTEQVFSDTLMTLLLKANRPEKYRERVDVAHSGGVKSEVSVRVDLTKLSDEQLEALESISETLAART